MLNHCNASVLYCFKCLGVHLSKVKTSNLAGICICGCKGLSTTHAKPNAIDYSKYNNCPARIKRKEAYKIRREKERELKWWEKLNEHLAESRREFKKQEKMRLEKENARDVLGLPALSVAEAKRRGMRTYQGLDCALGHGGERLTRNSECINCRYIRESKRSAMKRGAFPYNLTQKEKGEISKIYKEARQLTEQTGIKHHVDHIIPVSKGGLHKPTNLQILTAQQNLSKGSKIPKKLTIFHKLKYVETKFLQVSTFSIQLFIVKAIACSFLIGLIAAWVWIFITLFQTFFV